MKLAFLEVARDYGFEMRDEDDTIVLVAKNTDGEDVEWIRLNKKAGVVKVLGNTDHCNLWFHMTRKDLTPDILMHFVQDLNRVFQLKGKHAISLRDLIDPEDWQEIAGIHDAHLDERYLKS